MLGNRLWAHFLERLDAIPQVNPISNTVYWMHYLTICISFGPTTTYPLQIHTTYYEGGRHVLILLGLKYKHFPGSPEHNTRLLFLIGYIVYGLRLWYMLCQGSLPKAYLKTSWLRQQSGFS